MPISYYFFYKQHMLKQYEVNTSQSLCSRRHNNEYNMVTDRHGTGLLYLPLQKQAKIYMATMWQCTRRLLISWESSRERWMYCTGCYSDAHMKNLWAKKLNWIIFSFPSSSNTQMQLKKQSCLALKFPLSFQIHHNYSDVVFASFLKSTVR